MRLVDKDYLLNLAMEEESYGYVDAFDIIKSPTIEIVQCKDCKHRPTDTGGHNYGQDLEFPDDVCPCQIGDNWYSWMPRDDWFCKDGERKEDATD